MTEEEAKTKWCPFGHMYSPQGGAFNRNTYGEGTTKCLASKCMMWRWDKSGSFDEQGKLTEGRCGY